MEEPSLNEKRSRTRPRSFTTEVQERRRALNLWISSTYTPRLSPSRQGLVPRKPNSDAKQTERKKKGVMNMHPFLPLLFLDQVSRHKAVV